MQVRGAFNALLRPGLRRDFRDSYNMYPEEYGFFLKVGGLDRAEVEAVAISGLGRMARKTEIGPITYLDPVMSPKKTYVDEEFALGIVISQRLMEDDQYDRANQSSKNLGRSARLTQEYQAAALLDDAFTGAIFTGLNNEPLISATHQLLNGAGTWSNLISGNPALSVTGYQAAIEMSEGMVDHQGDPMPMSLSRLIVDRTDEFMAIQLTQNKNEPFTANNTLNTSLIKSGISSYRLSHYKQATGSWFLQDPNMHDMHFLFRVRPQFGDAMDSGNTNAAKFWSRQRILVYFFDQRGIIGSSGAGS